MSFTDPCPGTYGPGPLTVERPAVEPWLYGLLSQAAIIDETDPHARGGIVYKSPPCTADVQAWVDDCDSSLVAVKLPTDVDENAVVRGCPFHLYAALDCKTTTLDAMHGEVLEVFRLGEQRAIEEQVWTNVLATAGSTVLNPSSLPADAFTVLGGLAALESAIARCYGGRALIHADRGVALYADNVRAIKDAPDGSLITRLGSGLAFYGGSPNTSPAGVAAPDGFAWIYATSQLTLRRFPIDVLPTDVGQMLRYSPLTNEPYILAERTYVPSVECCAFGALVCLGC